MEARSRRRSTRTRLAIGDVAGSLPELPVPVEDMPAIARAARGIQDRDSKVWVGSDSTPAED